jgi:hypothetical protein
MKTTKEKNFWDKYYYKFVPKLIQKLNYEKRTNDNKGSDTHHRQ